MVELKAVRAQRQMTFTSCVYTRTSQLWPKINQTLWFWGFQDSWGRAGGGDDLPIMGTFITTPLGTTRPRIGSPSLICSAKLLCEPWQILFRDSVRTDPQGVPCALRSLMDEGSTCQVKGHPERTSTNPGALGKGPGRTSVHLQSRRMRAWWEGTVGLQPLLVGGNHEV